jgi:site-specific recombinase XerD
MARCEAYIRRVTTPKAPRAIGSRNALGMNRERAPQPAMTFMTYTELLDVLKVARQRRTRDWCMLLLAYRHGLRTTEVCGLKLHDVQNGTLSVQRRKGSRRTVQPLCPHPNEPLLDEVVALRAWLRLRRDDGTEALFTSQKGGAMDRSQFFRIFQCVAKAAGLPSDKQHPRLLKYSLASHLLARNAGLNLVSEILGHRSLHSTRHYVKATGGVSPGIAGRATVFSLQHGSPIVRPPISSPSSMG